MSDIEIIDGTGRDMNQFLYFLSGLRGAASIRSKHYKLINSLGDCEVALLRMFAGDQHRMDFKTLERRKGVYSFYCKQISKEEAAPMQAPLNALLEKKIIRKENDLYSLDPRLKPLVLYVFFSRLYRMTPELTKSHDIKARWVLLTAKKGSKTIGYLEGTLILHPKGAKAELDTIVVDPKFRKRKVGRRLVEAFEKICKDYGIGYITVDSEPTAVGFYEKLGYSKRFMEIGGNKDIIMEKNL